MSEWTRVVRKGKGNKSGRVDVPPPPPPAAGAPVFRPNPTPRLSPQDIEADHQKIAAQWRATDGYATLLETVRANAASHAPITRAICLGLGSFDPEDGSWAAQRRSHTQLAAFLAIVQVLEKQNHSHIECFYQEPCFAQPDKDFIASTQRGKIVESPHSYDLVDDATLVFGVHLYRDVWADALRRSLPGMFVGTGWDVWGQTLGSEKRAHFDRIRQMDAAFDRLPFPEDDQHSFSSTCIYWKRRVDDSDSHDDAAAPPAASHGTTDAEDPVADKSQDTAFEPSQRNGA